MSTNNRKRKPSFSSTTSSPAKKPKLAEGLLDDPEVYNIAYQAGQITRINLTNWVTFDQTEIICDPGLNLIVGPNGTGKSSVVCAICLGLGGKPRSLGRGDKASDFIKHGRAEARIEIELFAKNRYNDKVVRVITKNGSKWSLNGKNSTGKKIDEFVKNKRNIKVDNLCQFLAQDKVSAFAMLSAKDLLIETEKAIENDDLFKWHNFLMDAGGKADEEKKTIENLKQTLEQNIAEKNSLSKTIEQFEVKKKMEKQVRNYEALAQWRFVKGKWRCYKKKQKYTLKLKSEFEKKKANVGPLKQTQRNMNKKYSSADNKYKTHLQKVKKVDKERVTANKKLGQVHKQIEGYEDKIQQALQDYKQRAKNMKKFENEIEKLESKLDEFNEDDIKEAKKEKSKITGTDLKKLRNERNGVDRQLRTVTQQRSNVQHNLKSIEDKLGQMRNISNRRDGHIFDHRRQKEKQFKTWVETHQHTFKGQVFGPIVQQMTVRNDLHAKFLNNVMGLSQFYGYVCSDGRDWQTLLRKSQDIHLQCTIYTAPAPTENEYINRPVDKNILNQNGVDGYLDEIYDAPDIIKRTLNDVLRLHTRAYSMHAVNSRALDNVLTVHKGQGGRLNFLITPEYVYSVKASHYTSNVMRSANGVRSFGRYAILQKTPDYSIQIGEKEAEQKEMHSELDNIENSRKEIENKKKEILFQIQKLQDKKKNLEKEINSFQKFRSKLIKKRKDLKELENDGDDPEQIKIKYTQMIQNKNKDRVQWLVKLANDTEREKELMKLTIEYEITKKCYFEECKFVKQQILNIEKRNKTLRKEFDKSKREEQNLKREYEKEIQNAWRKFPRNNYENEWTEDDKKMNMDAIESKISSLQGRINVLFIDGQKVERYNRLVGKIDDQQKKLQKKQHDQANKHDQIKEIENKWKPKLLEAVEKISHKFGEFFAQFNKAEGKVELEWRDEETGAELRYCDWCIDIFTKFRKGKDIPWKRLTSSSQSGGEKSVSTMLYLLSLQQVTTVPFRVVDEINQGMDPINERRIMKILNYECTPKRGNNNINGIRHLPQYFVVTPKLLPRLEYSPCSSVYVIFNGPWQMAHKQWQMDKFIQSQKELTNNNNNRNNNDGSDDDDESESEDDDDDQEESD